MSQPNAQNIAIDGVNYPVASFSGHIQQMIVVHEGWSADLVKERMAVAKTEVALESMNKKLAEMVKAEIAARTAEAANETVD